MNEILADVYALTRNQKYLDLAKKFYHYAVMDPLARKEDQLRGRHGNTNIPKLIGAARIYELTGEENFGTSSEFFWETVVHNHSYVCGGHGESEYFGEPGKLNDRLSDNTMETCNSYNMLKLTRFLFMRDHIAFGRSDHFGGAVGPKDFSSPEKVIHIDRIYIPETQPEVRVRRIDVIDADGSRERLMENGKYTGPASAA